MPIGFEPGGAPLKPYELQRTVEDAFVEAGAILDQQHDGQGAHTDVTLDSITSRNDLPIALGNGLRFLKGPLLFEEDGNQPLHAVVQPETLTTNQDNYDPPFLSDAIVVELEASTPVTITGLVNERRRRALLLVNRGSATITLAHNSGSSTAIYRFFFDGLQDASLPSGAVLWIYYDAGSEIWRGSNPSVTFSPINLLQRVTVTYAAGATTATAAMTAVNLNKAAFTLLGEVVDIVQNTSQLDLANTTASVIALKRRSGLDGGGGGFAGTVVVQVVEYI